jgi:hypothetical protein
MERGAGYLESLSGLTTTGFTATLIAPQYSVGDGWNSTLSVVNLDGLPGQLKVTFMRDNGTPAAQSRVLSVPAHGLVAIDGKIFITEAGLSPFHGYAVIEGYGLSLAGSVRIGDANGNDFSTQLPLANAPESSVVFSQIASGSVFYTGLTILNPGLLDASVTLELYSQAGKLEASRTDVLPARQRRSKLLTEYFPELAGKERNGGYLRLKADPGVASFALIGTQSRSVLSALPGVRTR